LEKGCWYDFCEVASSFGKRLLTMSEFQVAAFGAPEAGSRGTDPGTVIWERASKWGLAQATGTLWTWGADLLFRDVNSQTFGYRTGVTRGRGSVYQQGNDDSLVAVRLGGNWGDTANSGSRASSWNYQPWGATYAVGARFAAEHLVTC
jgi:formylglycine-generating enzyme required for sulfatase activity